jgi:rSAM/selenodomain-associated transferase 1
MIPRHVIVFAREPRFGAVKSRLAADIGEGAAFAFYKRTLAGVLRRLAGDGRWTTWLAVTPPSAARRRATWQRGVPAFAQSEGDLGRRMAAAFAAVPPGPALIVGSDIPDLGPRQVAAAFRALATHDAVFGPTGDGGYYLVGLAAGSRTVDPFGGVRWSSRDALGDTLANLSKSTTIKVIESLIDIDTGDDLRKWRAGRGG